MTPSRATPAGLLPPGPPGLGSDAAPSVEATAGSTTGPVADAARRLLPRVGELHDRMVALEASHATEIERLPSALQPSARNLVHYVAFRQHDLRDLQRNLAALGLSSLGRLEAHALAGVQSVLGVLATLAGRTGSALPMPPVDVDSGARRLRARANALLGPEPVDRPCRIMVTLPTAAADDPALMEALVVAGMDVARINAAHDSLEAWTRMARNVRAVTQRVGRSCPVLVDLPGPKLRTGPMRSRPGVLRWRPVRDERGVVVGPAAVLFREEGVDPLPGVGKQVPVRRGLLHNATCGDEIRLRDCRGKRRSLTIVAVGEGWAAAEGDASAFVESGTAVKRRRHGRTVARSQVAELPPEEIPLLVRPGDDLILDSRLTVGNAAGELACTLPEVLGDLRPGEPIWFDDGKLGGTIVGNDDGRVRVRIEHGAAQGTRLRGDKGINLPASRLRLAAITEHDEAILRFAAAHADLVGLSFVRRAEDVRQLHRQLDALDRPDLGVLLKIETRQGFEHLPRLLATALERSLAGVMVARGDLAVEVGFERLAEAQEEILWFSEAAHAPVVWATQVLEGLAKTGMPSRAEVTDAAMAVRAECVMLNKGPHIVEAVEFLANVLRRMVSHQEKKRSTLRRLGVATMGE